MNAKIIICPTDFTPSSDTALEMATSLARQSGGKVLIVHVEEPIAAQGTEYLYDIPERDTEGLMRRLIRVKPADPNVAFDHRLLEGDAAKTIVALADAEQADLIVIGTHGRRGITRLLMGSVAEAVVRQARCPVLAVKQPAQAAGKQT